ncbi:MAG: hypothetical protein HOE30_07965 [Deltaproteobacteria bacterium]|nr:hypothetical protein [Deltaproteobacteria bacterium]
MSVKQVVFEYLEKHPKKSLDQVVDGLPEFKKASVRKYFYDFRKLQSVAKIEKKASIKTKQNKGAEGKISKKKGLNIRQRIYDLLTENPDVTIDLLCQKIEGSNRKTVRDYRNRWRKENLLTKPAVAAKEPPKDEKKFTKERKAVHDFMKQYPEANLNDLRKLFPKNSKLVTDFRSWKRQQPKNGTPVSKKAGENLKSELPAKSDKKAIHSLKQIIEQQKITIESQRSKLKEVRSQLAQASKFSLDGLKTFLANKIFNK